MAKAPKLRPWPADKVERRPLNEIHPYPANARIHSDDQVEQIAESMRRFGVTTPILIDEKGVIIYGHGRRRAAELLVDEGRTEFGELPVCIAKGWTEPEKRAYRLADNQIADNSEWDIPTLRAEYAELEDTGFADIVGFSDRQKQAWGLMPEPENEGDPNDIPEPPKTPASAPGDVWLLGRHRVICGDATAAETWKTLFGKDRAAMVFTDPPYGVSYSAASGAFEVIAGDDKRRDELFKMLHRSLREMARAAVDGAAFYIWHASSTREDFAQAMKMVGIVERQYLIWAKPSIVLGRADYHWQHEPCFYGAKGDKAPRFFGDRAESTVWHVAVAAANDTSATIGGGVVVLDGQGNSLYIQSKPPKNKKLRHVRLAETGGKLYLSGTDNQQGTVWEVARDGTYEHPTQKPVELARRAIENSSQPGEIVADGFLGSGGTLIGAELTARRCFGVELEPAYVDVVVSRWEKFTGREATLEDTGATYAATKTARAKGKPKSAAKKKGAATAAPATEPEQAPA